MLDYNFEILKIKKDKVNYFYRLFLLSSFILIIIFIIIMLGTSRTDTLECSKSFGNGYGSYIYKVKINYLNNKINSISGSQVGTLNDLNDANRLYNSLNEDIYGNNSFNLILDNDNKRVKLEFLFNNIDNKDLELVSNLMGINYIEMDDFKSNKSNFLIRGYICN